MKFIAILLLCAGIAATFGQEVRHRPTGYGSLRRLGEKEAEDSGRFDWPHVNDRERGTQVHLTFDFKDADVILLTYPPLSPGKMLAKGRGIAVALGCPNADYILADAVTYSSIDVELNKDLVVRGNQHSFSFDISKVATVLMTDPDLPKPILIRVETANADQSELSVRGRVDQLHGKSSFFVPREVGAGTTMTLSATVDWRAYASASLLIGFFGSAFAILLVIPWRVERVRIRAREEDSTAAPDPLEIQRKYDRAKPQWLTLLLFIAPVLVLTGGLRSASTFFVFAERVLPHESLDSRLILAVPFLGMVSVFGLNLLAIRIVRSMRLRRDPNLAARFVAKPDQGSNSFLKYLPIMLLPMILLVVAIPFIPGFAHLSPVARRVIIFGTVFGSYATFLILSIRESRKRRRALGVGEVAYDAAHEFAKVAGVSVRSVRVVKSTSCNASVDLAGNVTVTEKLLEKLDPDEVRAIIAHEVGHMKAKHLRTLLPISLALAAGLIFVYVWVIEQYRGALSPMLYGILSSALVPIFVLPLMSRLILGRRRRRNEREADMFAVTATGDPELVIRALEKVHTANAQPHRLKKSDEVFMAHPSLVNRVAHIRTRAAEAQDAVPSQ